MKRRGKILFAAVLLAMVALVFLWLTANPALRDLEATRRSLRQQGFKLELREFDYSIPAEIRRRTALLARTTLSETTNRTRSTAWARPDGGGYDLLTPIGTNSAMVTWKRDDLRDVRGENIWATTREMYRTNHFGLAAAREAAIGGSIRFEPIGGAHPGALLPYLADMKSLASQLSGQMLLALRDGRREEAWTNLLAVTCLATSYEPEPIEVSHYAWFGRVNLADSTTWNALQAPGWTDAQLADLQRRWEAVNFWTNLPATAAYARADMAIFYELVRNQETPRGMPLGEMMKRPADVWQDLLLRWKNLRYRHEGSYEEEKAMLLYYRDRELQFRGAIQATNWFAMRQLPGITNPPVFAPGFGSRAGARRISSSLQLQGIGLLVRATEAEARRRLIITALALERFHGRHAKYPPALADLAPEFFAAVPADFIDGRPLRYYATDDGHFVLYSIGLDGVDKGGRIRVAASTVPGGNRYFAPFGAVPADDLVWPRPASDEDIERQQIAVTRANQAAMAGARQQADEDYWNLTSQRLAHAKEILAAPSAPMTNEPMRAGRRLGDILQNATGTNKSSLFELLSLKQVITGDEPETVTFRLPIKHDVLGNLGELFLYVDACGDESEPGHYECLRAPNGDCLIRWSTIYEPAGQHAVFVGLNVYHLPPTNEPFFGPITPFVVTNLCQFTPQSASFAPETGANFYARLPESNGSYQVELKSTFGNLLKTISGQTSNGFFTVRWDLTDENGRRCTNNEYNSLFHITLPDSGRSQTLRGP